MMEETTEQALMRLSRNIVDAINEDRAAVERVKTATNTLSKEETRLREANKALHTAEVALRNFVASLAKPKEVKA